MRAAAWSALRWSSAFACLLGTTTLPAVVLAQEQQGSIAGTVLDSLGGALSGAQVSVQGTNIRAVSDNEGTFRLGRLRAGDVTLLIRRLGYRPESPNVRVNPQAETRLDVRMSALAMQLPTVEVRRKAEVYDSRLAGFVARQEKHVGHFVTREQLDRMRSARFVDALRQIPGVQMRPLRGGGTTVALRGSRCPPLVFIDGFPAGAGTMDLDMLDLASVEGIEVYSGVATVPAEFMGARGTHACGVIAVWSRPFRKRRPLEDAESVNLEQLLASQAVYTSDQVDDPARLAQGSVTPSYPDSLWRAGVNGRVVVEFIVDTAGVIEPGSLRVVSSTHPYFAAAVKSALESVVFRSAALAGKRVRQIVQLPFIFAPAGKEADSVRSPAQ
jgi:TonB family protein